MCIYKVYNCNSSIIFSLFVFRFCLVLVWIFNATIFHNCDSINHNCIFITCKWKFKSHNMAICLHFLKSLSHKLLLFIYIMGLFFYSVERGFHVAVWLNITMTKLQSWVAQSWVVNCSDLFVSTERNTSAQSWESESVFSWEYSPPKTPSTL